MFGLTNSEGNHGEDVEEYDFHLDSTPTHSYMTPTATTGPARASHQTGWTGRLPAPSICSGG